MRKAIEYAKYFMKKGLDTPQNSYDGNMKLQKLLVFAQMASLAEYGKPLFDDDIHAFKNGCVVENIRLRYKHDYITLKHDSDIFQPNFTEKEYKLLDTIIGIFGDILPRELSDTNHQFDFWKTAFEKGTNINGYHIKDKSIVNIQSYPKDIDKMRDIIDLYKRNSNCAETFEIINGIKFFYDGFELTQDIIEQLEDFSQSGEAQDSAYSIYIDDGELVIW